MKVERGIFLFVAVFFLIVAPIYWVVAHEIAGAMALLLAGLFGLMVTGYLYLTGRSIDKRWEDDKDGEIADGAGALGFFPPKSIWPFWAALTISIMVLGPVFGWWLTIIGAGLGAWALCGWVYEFYVGEYRH